jgi:hypothetical protein
MLGDDETTTFTDEFEQENGGDIDDDYYFENGDYTGLTSTAGIWSSGQEILRNGTNTDAEGLPRAVTHVGTIFHILFQLDASEANAANSFTYQTDLVGARSDSTSEVTFSLNGNPFFVQPAVSPVGPDQVPVNVNFNAGALGAVAGSNVLTIERTGGMLHATANNAWIQFDYHALNVAQIPEPSSLGLLALGGLLIASRFRRS